jgi:hypothetical protein
MAGEDDNIETPPPNNHIGGQVRLPTFWAQAPAMWFAQAECLFQLQGVTCQVKKYCYVVASLTHESMRRVSDLVEQVIKAPADGLSEGGQAVRVAWIRSQETFRAHVPDVGDLPQG